MLSRKHYKAIAEIIKTTQFPVNAVLASWMSLQDRAGFDLSARLWRRELAERLTNYFKRDNPNFKRERFLRACGLED